MSLFSQRQGIRPLEKAIQRESIDEALRNKLWSALKIAVWDRYEIDQYGRISPDGLIAGQLVSNIWLHYYGFAIDTTPEYFRGHRESAYDLMRANFFKGLWWQVYDFIEFISNNIPKSWNENLRDLINNFLEIEFSAYRLLENKIVEITDETEISSIESAVNLGIGTINAHLQKSIDLISDRQNPDLRNSIKESISAVESACQIVSGKRNSSLGDCLKELRDRRPMHAAFEKALTSLYGYSSDEGGIRHALTEDSIDPTYADAKFMLVACSAFVNYLLTKAAELKIPIKEI